MRIAKLEPRERPINISMDEVYTAQGVELAGGKYYGETADGSTTKTLFCIHMNSVSGKYEDMVSMQPVAHVRRDDIADAFNRARPYIGGKLIRRFVYICSADEMTSLSVTFIHRQRE